jgi:hypothetical protein
MEEVCLPDGGIPPAFAISGGDFRIPSNGHSRYADF